MCQHNNTAFSDHLIDDDAGYDDVGYGVVVDADDVDDVDVDDYRWAPTQTNSNWRSLALVLTFVLVRALVTWHNYRNYLLPKE